MTIDDDVVEEIVNFDWFESETEVVNTGVVTESIDTFKLVFFIKEESCESLVDIAENNKT